MYESQTKEVILERMKAEIDVDVDTREATPAYNSIAPSAVIASELYGEIDKILELGFADTSYDDFLEMRTSEMGIYRRKATKAVRRGNFNISVAVGERFFKNDLYFVVTKAGTAAELQCETAGTAGNIPTGNLIPVNNIPGLKTANLDHIIIPGTEEEDDASLLKRYKDRLQLPVASGNKNHYFQWALEVEGVGFAKVFPLWNGNGTVKVVIVNTLYDPASPELVAAVQEYIDPGANGLGEGTAPIGATTTIVSAGVTKINLSFSLTLEMDKKVEEVLPAIQEGIASYLRSVAFKQTVVRINSIGSLLLNTEGVIDYSGLTLNSQQGNIEIPITNIPQLGTVTIK